MRASLRRHRGSEPGLAGPADGTTETPDPVLSHQDLQPRVTRRGDASTKRRIRCDVTEVATRVDTSGGRINRNTASPGVPPPLSWELSPQERARPDSVSAPP